MPNKLPKMAEGMIQRVQFKSSFVLAKDKEGLLNDQILMFHTGRGYWPPSFDTSAIPNYEKAEGAKKKAKEPRNMTMVFDIDVDGEWHFVGFQ